MFNKSIIVTAAPAIFLLLWSAGFTVAKIGILDASPLTLLALRYFCVVLFLIPFFFFIRPPLPATARQWLDLALVGFLVQVVYFGMAYLAFGQGMSAGGVALVTSLQPILVAVVMPALSSERVSAIHWFGFVLGLAGAILVIVSNNEIAVGSFAGLALTVGALLAITVAIIWEKLFGEEHHPVTANGIQYLIGFLFTLPLAWWTEDMRINWTTSFTLALLYLVLMNSILAISLLLMMVRRGEATRVSALFFLVPPISGVIAWIGLGETMATAAWFGMIIAAVGVYFVTRRVKI